VFYFWKIIKYEEEHDGMMEVVILTE